MSKKLIIHDISMTLEDGMLTYPKDTPYRRSLQRAIGRGDTSNVSEFSTTAHVGTHVDAPRHYLNDSYGVDKLPLESLFGPAYVLDCRGQKAVTGAFLAERLPADKNVERLLLKTDNSARVNADPKGEFFRDFVYLDGSGARVLADRGVKLVAIDYLSIDKSGLASKPAHFTLLENRIVIVEGVLLAQVEPGWYFLTCGPLKMADADGAPCRAILLEGLDAGF